MSPYDAVELQLVQRPSRSLVIGAAGFIGSHLTETLFTRGQDVARMDNFATGSRTYGMDCIGLRYVNQGLAVTSEWFLGNQS
jgi:nucleoside-diphosphate-sugar epimerase